jgi:diguanylate cyclase
MESAMAALDPSMGIQLDQLRRHASADRADAARDRAHAARDRAEAASERARLQAELLTAHFDGLTGAFQRELGMVTLEHEVARARRGDGTFALGFVDVDDLKRINDRQGHVAGDEALRVVVKVLRSHLRSFDPVLRYGGDEFVAGMTGMDLESADARFAAVQLALEAEAGVRISVGLAALQPGETVAELIGRADAILYRRRNRPAASPLRIDGD